MPDNPNPQQPSQPVKVTGVNEELIQRLFDDVRGPLIQTFEEHNKNLISELQGIRTSLDALTNAHDKAAKTTKDAIDNFYTTGHSGQASTGGGSGSGTGGSGGSRSGAASTPQGGSFDPDEVPQGPSKNILADAWTSLKARESLGTLYKRRPLRDVSAHTDIVAWDQGMTPGQAMASQVAQYGGVGVTPPPIPQIGQYTAQDLLAWAGSRVQSWSANRYAQNDTVKAAHGTYAAEYQNQIDNGADEADARAAAYREMQRQHGDALASVQDRRGNALATAARSLHGMSEFSAQVSLFHQYSQRYGYDMRTHSLEGTGGLEGTGERTGVSGSGRDINIGPFGLRIPGLNPAALAGVGEEWEKTKLAMKSGINKTQANFIYDQLYDRGWLEGKERDNLVNGAADVMRYNKQLGMDPATFDALDKSTRHGTTGVQAFVKVVKEIPEAARSARVSLQQMNADANAMGEANQQQGGTFWQGYKNAIAMSGMSGLPAGVLGESFQNPIVQGYAMTQTGLAPQAQGLMSAGQRMRSIMEAVNGLAPAFGNIPGRTNRVPGAGNFNLTTTGKDQQMAWLHQMFPEYSPEMLKALTDPKTRAQIESGANVEDAAMAWSRGAGGAKNAKQYFSGDRNAARNNWGTLKKDYLQKAAMVDPDTGELKRMFTDDEIKDIENAGKFDPSIVGTDAGVFGKGDHGISGRVKKLMEHPQTSAQKRRDGESMDDYRKRLAGMVAATERYKKIKDIVSEKGDTAQSQHGPKAVIELGPNAKKFFKISGVKGEANAGQTSANIPFASGPTTTPGVPEYGLYGNTNSNVGPGG